jgi:hypothetical protein
MAVKSLHQFFYYHSKYLNSMKCREISMSPSTGEIQCSIHIADISAKALCIMKEGIIWFVWWTIFHILYTIYTTLYMIYVYRIPYTMPYSRKHSALQILLANPTIVGVESMRAKVEAFVPVTRSNCAYLESRFPAPYNKVSTPNSERLPMPCTMIDPNASYNWM